MSQPDPYDNLLIIELVLALFFLTYNIMSTLHSSFQNILIRLILINVGQIFTKSLSPFFQSLIFFQVLGKITFRYKNVSSKNSPLLVDEFLNQTMPTPNSPDEKRRSQFISYLFNISIGKIKLTKLIHLLVNYFNHQHQK